MVMSGSHMITKTFRKWERQDCFRTRQERVKLLSKSIKQNTTDLFRMLKWLFASSIKGWSKPQSTSSSVWSCPNLTEIRINDWTMKVLTFYNQTQNAHKLKSYFPRTQIITLRSTCNVFVSKKVVSERSTCTTTRSVRIQLGSLCYKQLR